MVCEHPEFSPSQIQQSLNRTEKVFNATYTFWGELKSKGIFHTDTFWYFEPFAWVTQMKKIFSKDIDLRGKVKSEVEAQIRGYLEDMDAFSKSIVSPVFSDLATYSTDLAMKKVTQKGAWEDSEKVYSLLAVDRNEVITITDKVFRNFVDNASKNLGNSTK